MSNLVLLQGKTSRSEMIKNVSRGILVKTIGVGGENYPGLGSFALSVRDGRFITNGKVGEGTGRLMIQGLSADFLRKIASVGQKLTYKPLATLCEKHQQRLYTDGLAPPFLVRSLNVLSGENESIQG
jgi:predicted Zn-dependent protease